MVEVSIHWTEGTSETAWTALSWPVRVATVAWHNMLFTCIHVVQFYMSNNSAFWRMVFHLLVLYIPNNDGLVLQSNFFEFPLDTFSKGDKLYTPPKTKKKTCPLKRKWFFPPTTTFEGGTCWVFWGTYDLPKTARRDRLFWQSSVPPATIRPSGWKLMQGKADSKSWRQRHGGKHGFSWIFQFNFLSSGWQTTSFS